MNELTITTEVQSLRDLSPQQWKSGIAAWLGWMFDGLDMHLYTLVALVFVAQLSQVTTDPQLQTEAESSLVKERGAWIQAAFLVGWALGGGFFGVIADRIGRSRALMLTILTYACFTGVSYLAQEWWHLLLFRFLAALGIGGEWAVGASLLAETWPKRWRPWLAAILQTGVNIGVLAATLAYWVLAGYEPRVLFLVGVIPAFLVLWIRRAVPEPEEWHSARVHAEQQPGRLSDLFRGSVRRITCLALLVCGCSLTAHWAFMFWSVQHLRETIHAAGVIGEAQNQWVSAGLMIIMLSSIVGNFGAGFLALHWGYRPAIIAMCLAYFGSMVWTYSQPRDPVILTAMLVLMGISQGMFALFTMYLPPLFPTLLRTTGAGFSYNFGRIAAAAGTVVFNLIAPVQDLRYTLLYASVLFLPAAFAMLFMPEHEPIPPRT